MMRASALCVRRGCIVLGSGLIEGGSGSALQTCDETRNNGTKWLTVGRARENCRRVITPEM
jgi:hypothetical protein